MKVTRLGRTNLTVTRTAFGVLPLQRVDMEEAINILRRAYDGGITFYDTARFYTDSEEKIGRALSDVRDKIVIATKTMATTKSGVLAHLEDSLRNLKTDYVDLFQLHNPDLVPDANDPESSIAGLLEAKKKGLVRHLGFTNHRLNLIREAMATGLYDTMQYPLCYISSERDLALIDECKAADLGFIAMKPFSGGLITNARAAFAFFRQYENVVPIYGIQRMTELEEILGYEANPPAMDSDILSTIEHDRKELAVDFCRGCGYCLPCPAKIPIINAARMGLMVKRLPPEQFLTDECNELMHRIENCIDCGHCKSHCPYKLDTPRLLRRMLEEYEVFYQKHKGAQNA